MTAAAPSGAPAFWPAFGAGERRATLLVPSERHVELGLAHRERLGLPGIAVRTPRGFLQRAMAALAPDRRLVGSEVTALAARRVLDAMPAPPVRYPDEPAARAAFALAVDRAVGALRRAGTGADRLRAVGLPEARLLADVLEGVDAALDRAGVTDARAAGIEVARLLATADPRALAEVVTPSFVVSGIAGFEAGDLGWLEALHARSRPSASAGRGGLRLILPRLGSGDDDPMAPIADSLERRWASLDDAPEIEWSAPPAPREPGATTVIEARHLEAEARAVAAHVLRALADGVALERVAIVVPDLDEGRLESLRSALSVARVPFSEPRGRPASSNPEARAALALLAMAEGPIKRDHLIELLRTPGAHTGAWMERASEGDAAVRATALAHRLRDLPVNADATGELFVKELSELSPSRPGEVWMPRALAHLLDSVALLRGVGSRRALARRLGDLFDRLELGRPSVGELGAALREELRSGSSFAIGALGEGAAAVRAVREALVTIVEGASAIGEADTPCTAAEIAVEMEQAARTMAGGSASRAGCARIARAGDLAGLSHGLLVVTGLGARAYGGGGDALLDERITAALPAVVRPAGLFEREAFRRAELAWALAHAERVVLSRSAPEGEDELGEPHPLVAAALAQKAHRHVEPGSRVAARASAIDARSARLIAVAQGAEADPPVLTRAAIERARAAFFLDPRAPSDGHTGLVALRNEADAAHLRACIGGASSERAIAVTVIERAAGCAFAGFAGRVLRVRRAEDTGEAASARDRGTLVHRALEAAFEGAREVWFSGDPPRILGAARAAAERAVRSAPGALMAPLRREAVSQAVTDALGAVLHAIEHDDGARFALAERRFGPRDPPPWHALELAPDEGDDAEGEPLSVFIEGQIDRIDRTADGRRVRVVDYKTGRMPDPDDHGRTLFQLPLYAEVVARSAEAAEIETLYQRIRTGGAIEERPRADQDRTSAPADRAAARSAARRVVLRQWRGDVAPRPLRASACTYCDARDVCRRPAVMPVDDDEGE